MPPFPTSNMSGSERMVYMQIEIKIHTHKWRLVALPTLKRLCQDHILTIPSTRTSIGSPLVIKISNGSHAKQKTEERLGSIILKSYSLQEMHVDEIKKVTQTASCLLLILNSSYWPPFILENWTKLTNQSYSQMTKFKRKTR